MSACWSRPPGLQALDSVHPGVQGGLLLTVKLPLSLLYLVHYNWLAAAPPPPTSSSPFRSLTLSETQRRFYLRGHPGAALLVFMLPYLWETLWEWKWPITGSRLDICPRGPNRISAALLSCSPLPLLGKSELSKSEMKERLLGRWRDVERSPGFCIMTWTPRASCSGFYIHFLHVIYLSCSLSGLIMSFIINYVELFFPATFTQVENPNETLHLFFASLSLIFIYKF